MFEDAISILIRLAVLCAGIYCLLAVAIPKFRMSWSGTNIKTGSITNFAIGFFFIYGVLLTFLAELPFESFFVAIVLGVIPMVASWVLGVYGYQLDAKRHREKFGSESNT